MAYSDCILQISCVVALCVSFILYRFFGPGVGSNILISEAAFSILSTVATVIVNIILVSMRDVSDAKNSEKKMVKAIGMSAVVWVSSAVDFAINFGYQINQSNTNENSITAFSDGGVSLLALVPIVLLVLFSLLRLVKLNIKSGPGSALDEGGADAVLRLERDALKNFLVANAIFAILAYAVFLCFSHVILCFSLAPAILYGIEAFVFAFFFSLEFLQTRSQPWCGSKTTTQQLLQVVGVIYCIVMLAELATTHTLGSMGYCSSSSSPSSLAGYRQAVSFMSIMPILVVSVINIG